jgi:hypothetical protein
MAGSDQSVNLGGMLGDIGKTVGSMGDAYEPVMQAATKPRGSMEDPNHLQALAQWASRNGDSAAATMYMQQARELKADQKEQKNIKYNADTYAIASEGTAHAGTGDVTNLDRNIAMLQERVANATSTQQQAQAQRALEAAQASRKGAVGQQNKNHAQAITAIDAQLASGVDANGNPVDPRALEAIRNRKEELLKNPEVQSVLNEQNMEAFRAKQAQDAMEEQAYLDKNMPALRDAVNDPAEADRIISEAPPAAQDSLRQTFNSMRQFQKGIEETEALFADVKVPSDMKTLQARVSEIPEELRAGATATLEKIRDIESRRDGNGLLTQADAISLKNARTAHTTSLVSASNAIGQQEYAARRGQERKVEAEVQELRESLETYRPTDADVSRRAEMLAEKDSAYVKVGADRKGKGGRTVLNTGLYMEDAAASLRQEHEADVNKQIAIKTGEVAETREFTESEEARIQEGLRETGATRDQVINHLDANDLWSPKLEEVTVPNRKLRSGESPVNRTGASAIYKDSFINQGIDAVGDFFDDRGRRAKEKLRDNPYG